MYRTNDENRVRKERHEIDWDNDQDILDFVMWKWNLREFYYRGRHRRWLETIAAYEGFWYYDFDTALRKFSNSARIPPWRIRLVINLLLPRVRTYVSKLLRNRPTFDVLPATADTKDINVASRNKKILRGYWYQKEWNNQFVDLLLWLGLTGNAYLYVYWDPHKGPLYQAGPQDFVDTKAIEQAGNSGDEEALTAVIEDANQRFVKWQKKNKGNELFLGDCEWKSVCPLDVVYPECQSFDEKEWIITSQLRDISYYATLGYDISKFKRPGDKDKRWMLFLKRIDSLAALDVTLGLTKADQMEIDDTKILELNFWLPPGEDLKHGYHCVIAGGMVLPDAKGPIPYNHRQIPLVHLTAEKTPGKVLGFSAAEQTIPQMREYQRTRSQMIEIRNLMAKPKWLVPKMAHISKSALTSEPGEIVEYSGTLAPEQAAISNIPRFVTDLQGLDIRDLDEIWAQRDASKGINQSGVRSMVQNANLQDQDDGSLAIVGLILNTGISKAGRLTLATIDQFVKEDRLTAYLGERKRYESVTYGKDSLSGPNRNIPGADYFGVRVTDWTQFGLSRAGQLEFLKVLLQYQIFTANDRAKVLEFVEMGYFEDQIDEGACDRSNAYQENILMMQGGQLQPQYTDNHLVHLEEHKNFMNENFGQLQRPALEALLIHIHLTELEAVKSMVRPQVLQVKALLMVCAEEQVPPQLLALTSGQGGAETNGNGSRSSSGGSSGSRSNGQGSSRVKAK